MGLTFTNSNKFAFSDIGTGLQAAGPLRVGDLYWRVSYMQDKVQYMTLTWFFQFPCADGFAHGLPVRFSREDRL
jgi:hypothetical protein